MAGRNNGAGPFGERRHRVSFVVTKATTALPDQASTPRQE